MGSLESRLVRLETACSWPDVLRCLLRIVEEAACQLGPRDRAALCHQVWAQLAALDVPLWLTTPHHIEGTSLQILHALRTIIDAQIGDEPQRLALYAALSRGCAAEARRRGGRR